MIIPKYQNKLSDRLQQDIIIIDGKKIFLNPFLYSRKFDKKTDIWLKQFGQISNSIIISNRSKFYPEIDWKNITETEKLLKDSTIEFFLKTIEIIKVFHFNLNTNQLLEITNKLSNSKKIAFEKWVKERFAKEKKIIFLKNKKLKKENIIRKWKVWFSIEETKKAFTPFFVIMILSFLIGWFGGVSKNSCNPYFESSINKNFKNYV